MRVSRPLTSWDSGSTLGTLSRLGDLGVPGTDCHNPQSWVSVHAYSNRWMVCEAAQQRTEGLLSAHATCQMRETIACLMMLKDVC